MRIGMGFKLAVLLAAFAVLAAGLTGYNSYSTTRKLLVARAEMGLQTSTQVLGQRLAQQLREVADDARFLSAIPVTRHAFNAQQGAAAADELAGEFATLLAVRKQYLQVRLIAADGNGLERVRVQRDGAQTLRVGGLQLQEKGHFPYVYRTQRLGAGQVYVSDISISQETGSHTLSGRPTLRVAAPVMGDAGAVVGVLVIDVDMQDLFDELKASLPAHYQVYLANQQGDFLLHVDAARAFGFDHGQRYLMQEEFPATAAIFTGDSPRIGMGWIAGEQGHRVAAFERIPYGEPPAGRFAVLGLAVDRDLILQDAASLARTSVHGVLLFSVLAVLLALLAARAYTRSLHGMVRAVERFNAASEAVELPVQRRDEIGLLARSFAAMQTRIQAQVAELHRQQQRLEQLARQDPLTGAPNRLVFLETLTHAITVARRSGRKLAVLFLDLDRFKEINDLYGHAAGDALLREMVVRLQGAVRQSDSVARLGGDEFIVLLDALEDEESALVVARKLLDLLQMPVEVDGHRLQVSGSIGLAFYPEHGDTAEELIIRADEAMYSAKQAGRDTLQVYAPR